MFRRIQAAYDVLSDPQERAWFDKHRDRILQGGFGSGDNYKEERLDVFQYHTTACFSGFADDDEGFYAIYRDVFEKLADEERRAAADNDAAGSDVATDDESMYPSFGSSESDYETVVGVFYGFWDAFSTRKSYAWTEQYDARDAPNRPTKRAMEAENKKLRDAARKERNQEVRELVRFVRNRDKRVAAHRRALEERRVANERKARARQAAQRAAHVAEAAECRPAAWTDMAQFEAELCRLEADGDSGAEEATTAPGDAAADASETDEEDGIYCLVCEKVFRSERQLENHTRSKKHKERLAALQRTMLAEDSALFGGTADALPLEDELEDEPLESVGGGGGKSKRSKRQKRRQKQQHQEQEEQEEEVALAEEADEGEGNADVDVEGDAAPSKPPQNHLCQVCSAAFASRNQLYKHIEREGHAALKTCAPSPAEAAAVDGKRTRKKGRR